RIEFEAVFHSARIWLNGRYAGEHLRKGYTAFMLDLSHLIKPGANYLVVQVDNRFDDRMLPRNNSYDWAADGGITRPVSLCITPKNYLANVPVTAIPDLVNDIAPIQVRRKEVYEIEEQTLQSFA